MRTLHGWQHRFLYIYIVAIGLFHLYTAAFGNFEAFLQRNIHLMLILPLSYLLFPAHPKANQESIPWYDWLCALLALLPSLYIVINYEEIINRIQQVDPLTQAQLVLGSLLVVMLFEGARRVVGLPLVMVAAVFTAYMFFADHMPGILRGVSFGFAEGVEQLFLTDEGIFSMPIGVSATFVIIFLIFGGFLEKSGAGAYFMDLAQAFTGARPGGPARVAVVSSCLLGSINGSAVANVYGTGTFTIPLMKKIGFSPKFAGAVEAVASSGGQLMPPVMGAGAFLMASFLNVPYRDVMIAAIFPALLYYGSVFLMTQLVAYKSGMRGLPAADLPKKSDVLKRSYMLLPIVGLVVVLLYGLTPMKAGLAGIAMAWLVSLFNKEHRMGPREIIDAIYIGTKNIPLVCLACATAGIVLGSVALTGVGGKLISFVIEFAGGMPLLALVLVMLVSIVLGMGLPTTGAYILAAALCAPVLIKLGFLPIAAHMFVFYYAIISNITPPVALAAYAASSIAGADPNRTGFEAMRLGFLAFIVPFAFCYDPGILMQGNLTQNLLALVSGSALLFALGYALMGYIRRPLNWIERGLLLVAAGLLLTPVFALVIVGCGLLAGVYFRGRKTGDRDQMSGIRDQN